MLAPPPTTTKPTGRETTSRSRALSPMTRQGIMIKSAPRTTLKSFLCILLVAVTRTTTTSEARTTAQAFQPQQQRFGGRTASHANGAGTTHPFRRSAGFRNPSTSIRRGALLMMFPRDDVSTSDDGRRPISSPSCADDRNDDGVVPSGTPPAAVSRSPASHLQGWKTAVAAFVLSSALILGAPQPSMAATYGGGDNDTNSPAVESAITALRQAKGSSSDTFKAFESIGDIITEGKGVGGSINYKGVQLERGYVADEDTTIYNPGLTLLTETEKTNLVQAVIEARSNGLTDGSWNDDNQLAYEFLKDKLDPLHMAELKGYLSVFPIVVGVAYVTTLAVQQLVRDLFPVAYVVGVLLVIAPALALVALGPS